MTKPYVEELESRCQELQDALTKAEGWNPKWIQDPEMPHVWWYEAPYITLGYTIEVLENKRKLYVAVLIPAVRAVSDFMGGVRCGSTREAKEYIEHTVRIEGKLINRNLKFV
jgi:hypothetical protein